MSLLKNKKILLLLSLFLIFIPLILSNKIKAEPNAIYELNEIDNILYLSLIQRDAKRFETTPTNQYLEIITSEDWQYSSLFSFEVKINEIDYQDFKKFKIEGYVNGVLDDRLNSIENTINYPDGITIEFVFSSSLVALGFPELGNGAEIGRGQTLKFRLYFYDKKDNVSPTISGKTIFLSDYENPVSIQTIKNNLSVHDEIDGIISKENIYVKEDNFTPNKNRVGNFNITFAVKDKSQNEGTFIVTVRNLDLKAPKINSVKDIYEVSYKDTLDLNSVLLGLSATDNYDTGMIQIKLKTNNYTKNKSVPGVYVLTYEAKDSSGNISTKDIKVKVIDNIKPIISGQFTWEVSYTTPLSLEVIKSKLVVVDEIDKTLNNNSIKVNVDNYSSSYQRPGNYQIDFKATDSSNNTAVASVLIKVKDDQSPTIITNNFFISFDKANSMTKVEIISFMKEKGLLPMDFVIGKKSNEYREVFSDYEVNKEGQYLMTFESNETKERYYVNVLTNEEDLVLQHSKDVWKDIKEFFVKNAKYFIFAIILAITIISGAFIYRIFFKNRRNHWR